MQNTLIGGLLLFGGIWVSLGNNKTRGTILLVTLLLIVSLSLVINLQPAQATVVSEYFDAQPQQQVPQQQQPMALPENLPMPLTVPQPQGVPQQQGVPQPQGVPQQQGVQQLMPTQGVPQQQGVQQLMPTQVVPMPQAAQQLLPTQVVQQQQVAVADNKCRRVVEQAPNPSFNKILGKAAKTVENVQFIDTNNCILESGTSSQGVDFNFQCPDGMSIVGYDINDQGKERSDTSIFGGLGPVYCADGTIIGSGVGKVKSSTVGQKPQTNLSKFTYVDSKVLPFDNNMMGTLNESTLDQCASVCDFLKDSCGGFTYNTADKKCGLAYSVDKTRLQQGTSGRTYMKAPAK